TDAYDASGRNGRNGRHVLILGLTKAPSTSKARGTNPLSLAVRADGSILSKIKTGLNHKARFFIYIALPLNLRYDI
ncbi:MAG: hypothetical protein H6Q52_2355, partial [Deltaproteobacteria bacterium]|nr:hypothetical protein [Deltaproteobacteria bacterium]